MAQILVQMAVPLNKYSFYLHVQPAPFRIKANLRENRFFATRWAVGWRKGHFFVLNFLPKTRQRWLCHVSAHEQRYREQVCLLPLGASGCRACWPRPTQAASGKCSSKLPAIGCLRLVKDVWNAFRQVAFWCTTMFWHSRMGQDFRLKRILVLVFRASMRGVSLGFASQGNKPLPLYGHLNRQDHFVLNDGGFVKH